MVRNTEARREAIRKILLSREMATVAELCEELSCSEATIRTDLRHLESQKLLKRIPGGAIAIGNTPLNLGVEARASANQEAKRSIVDYAFQKYIVPGSTIILDAGTTMLLLAEKIAASDIHINVVTNNLMAAAVLVKNKKVKLFLCGGICDSNLEAFWGATARRYIKDFHAQQCFLSVNGLDEQGGTITFPEESHIKKAMMDSADRTIVLADHTKLGQSAFMRIFSLEDIDLLITDPATQTNDIVQSLESQGLAVEYARL